MNWGKKDEAFSATNNIVNVGKANVLTEEGTSLDKMVHVIVK